ncbi:NAD(P)/FAD-dependent oxidoreductase [Tunturiibacter gelidiferens]|uniref:NAD(P)/FAD-dependent oxidoreductase n=1 Tax=Tunturiibacter gelidiferens TaxID=3069689 RepID=UPI003D9AF856
MTESRTVGASEGRVIIVGGGAVGVCCAYFLATAGFRVLLLEENEICSGCSYGNLGLLAASHCTPLASAGVIAKATAWMFDPESTFSIHWRSDPQLAAWLSQFVRVSYLKPAPVATAELLRLVLVSMSLFDQLSRREDLSFGYKKQGVLELFATTTAFRDASRRTESLRRAGLEVEILDPEATRLLEPAASSNVCGSLLYKDDCHIQPADFVLGLADVSRGVGVEILEHSRITSLRTSGNCITGVCTRESFFAASIVILAAGCATPSLAKPLGVSLSVQPARGYSFTAPGRGADLLRPIMLAESKALLTPMGNDLRLGGVLELTEVGSAIDARRAQALVKSVCRYLSPEISFDGLEPWSGYRPCSPDGFPIVGWSQRWENLIYATGHGMLGLTLAPLTGQITAELAAGKPLPYEAARLSPTRFGSRI